jgi:WD40 repeat protein
MASEPPKVFISYNRADRDWAEWIAGAIDRSGYQPIIQAWDFRPGQNFVLRMQEAMAESDLTIAVLSEDYLKAEFTQSEWAAAFARDPTGKNRKLIPVRVAKCHLPPILSEIIYIDLVGRAEQDAERALLDGLKPSGKPAQPPPFPGKRAESDISSAPFPPNIARLHGVPNLPPHYLPREDVLAEIKQKLLVGDASIAITGQGQAVGVQGMGGIGKTVLAAALAHDSEVRQAFPDGIYWLTVGQTPNRLDLQNQLLRRLTGSKETLTTEQEHKDALREALQARTALLIIDDVWTIDHADAFSVTGPPSRLLITTRNDEVLVGLDAEEQRVDVLSPTDALKMLAEWVGEKSPDKLPPEAAEIAKECGYLPLALAMIGAIIRLRPTAWKDALGRLRRADLEAVKRNFPGYLYPNLLRAIEVSVEGLESADRERYLDLAVFPEDQPIPEEVLRLLWNLDEVDTRDCMTRLIARSLGTWATGETSLILHDLQRDLIHKRREKDLPGLHLRLVEAWNALPKLPNAYAWRWIAYHLVKAERKDDLYRILLDFDYLQGKLLATDPSALIADYHLLADDQELRLVQSTLRLSAHTLAHDPVQLAAQLLARIGPPQDSAVQRLLSDAQRWSDRPWLRPRLASLAETDGPLLSTFRGREADGHAGTPRSMTFSANGAWLATAGNSSNDCTVKIWNVGETRLAQTFQGAAAEGGVTPLLFLSPKRLAVANDRELRIYGMDGDKATDIRTFDAQITSLARMPGQDAVIVGFIDGTIECVECVGKMHVRSLLRVRDGQRVDAIVVSHDGALIACVAGSRVECQRLADTQLVGRVDVGDDRPIGMFTTLPLAFKNDGRVLFGATLKVWIPSEVAAVPALPDQEGPVVAIASAGTHALLHIDQNTVVARRLTPRSSAAYLTNTYTYSCYAITTDGSVAATGDHEHDVKLWNPAVYGRGADRSAPVQRVAIADDSRHAVVFRSGPSTEVWDVETGGLDPSAHHPITPGSLMRNGVDLLDSLACDSVREELTTREPLRSEMDTYGNPVGALTFSRRAGRALSAPLRGGKGADIEEPPGSARSDDSVYALRVWELGSTAPPQMLHGHTMSISCVAMTPDGRLGLTGSNGRLLRLWDLDRGACLYVLRGHKGRVFAVALTDDGRFAVSGSEDMTLCLWDLRVGHLLYTFTGSSAILTCDISPDASNVIAGERSGRVHLMDVAALPPVATIEG